MDQEENPTPPAESAPGEAREGAAKPSVKDLLAASRGEVVRREAKPAARATVVPPSAAASSSGTVPDAAPAGDGPGKEVPAGTPTAARVTPGAGAAKAASTPTAAVAKGVTKAAARPPAGPLVQSAPEPPVNKMRRRIVWASLAAISGSISLIVLRFFLPRAIFEPSSVFRIGFPGDYATGVDTKWQQQRRIWVVKNSERIFVIRAVCTHLGCTPDWKASENKFKCPCHGSGYDSEGINFEGPAPRPMDRAHVSLDATGQIVVDVNRLYDWQKGATNKFDEPGAYISI